MFSAPPQNDWSVYYPPRGIAARGINFFAQKVILQGRVKFSGYISKSKCFAFFNCIPKYSVNSIGTIPSFNSSPYQGEAS